MNAKGHSNAETYMRSVANTKFVSSTHFIISKHKRDCKPGLNEWSTRASSPHERGEGSPRSSDCVKTVKQVISSECASREVEAAT